MIDPLLRVARNVHPSGAVVLDVVGELDHFTAPELSAALCQEAFSPDVPVLVDLSGLQYCDSTGMTVFVKVRQTALQRAGRLALVGLSADLARMFRITGLASLFVLASTSDEAVEALRA
ncbi:anti-sigma factor antagonist [Pseudonocardiaceae bacterium YIM PH 21723]|nr:anti-sigma factor antagonist [Pseudonocardiaceae bacterium YIM PH 21723]